MRVKLEDVKQVLKDIAYRCRDTEALIAETYDVIRLAKHLLPEPEFDKLIEYWEDLTDRITEEAEKG